ncbi:MAG: hypothetical protein ALECFALPRED_005502 [Alectoria fallacina]|uniref:Mid2 domain-containing protein n=1 Tax=Alectoria fallacina TaxID=1903189 RepID=A0A8H3IY13_9LECA|nr:MAG: hypothetical protein ALECFALPRED_005502 [Alectoria fallacina]
MSLRSLCLCILLLRFHPIFGPHALAASDEAPGKLNLYDDFDCDHPSTLKPTVTLPVSTCLITTGGEGLVIDELPACSQGNATLIYYSDTACGVQTTDVSTSIVASSCNQLAAGTDLYNANAVMFSCQPAANNPQPTSTTTAVVSALAAVATGSTESNGSGSGSGSSSPSSTSTAGSAPTDTSTLKNSTSSGGSNSNDGTSTSTNTGSGSDSGLDTGDKIALAVGLGIGIPTILIMLAAWLFPDFRNQLRRRLPSRLDQLAFQRNDAHQWHSNGTHGMYLRQQPSHAY